MTRLPRDVIEAAPGWRSARRMLCVRLDSIGDVLMTSPALRAVKESSPGRQVTLLTSAAGAAVARLIPLIDEAITYDAPWMKATAPHADPTADLALIERLRSGAFDAAVIFTCFSQSPLPAALLCFLAGIPLRLAHCRENAYQLLSERVSECEPEGGVRHEVVRQLDLVAAVGYHTADDRLALEVPPEAKVAMTRRLCDLGLERRSRSVPWAVLHPGATAASRRYPAEQYAAVARRLVSEHGWRLLYTGGEGERELVEQVIAGSGVPGVNLAGALSLEELAALIARAPLLITNNTGPAHIAAAVGTPVVDLYAQTNPQHTPWHVPCRVLNQDVPCRWCYKSVCPQGHQRCLREVPPASVVAAAVELAWEMGRD